MVAQTAHRIEPSPQSFRVAADPKAADDRDRRLGIASVVCAETAHFRIVQRRTIAAHPPDESRGEALLPLVGRLLAMRPDGLPAIVYVSGVTGSDEAAIVARRIAGIAGRQSSFRTLLLDAEGAFASQAGAASLPALTQGCGGDCGSELALIRDGTGAFHAASIGTSGWRADGSLLHLLARHYELVVICVPPILEHPFSAPDLGEARRFVLALRAGRTRVSDAVATANEIQARGDALFAAVLTRPAQRRSLFRRMLHSRDSR
ncbi:MAG: hypothetical protein JOZ42_14975 [Acetobacteraceae bacterium]|nr:hypothetical protein [Acetobacteraceae bacterium]